MVEGREVKHLSTAWVNTKAINILKVEKCCRVARISFGQSKVLHAYFGSPGSILVMTTGHPGVCGWYILMVSCTLTPHR